MANLLLPRRCCLADASLTDVEPRPTGCLRFGSAFALLLLRLAAAYASAFSVLPTNSRRRACARPPPRCFPMPTSSSLISLLYVCSVLSTATHTYDLYKYRSQYPHVHIYRHIDILYVAMLWVDHIMPTYAYCLLSVLHSFSVLLFSGHPCYCSGIPLPHCRCSLSFRVSFATVRTCCLQIKTCPSGLHLCTTSTSICTVITQRGAVEVNAPWSLAGGSLPNV